MNELEQCVIKFMTICRYFFVFFVCLLLLLELVRESGSSSTNATEFRIEVDPTCEILYSEAKLRRKVTFSISQGAKAIGKQ